MFSYSQGLGVNVALIWDGLGKKLGTKDIAGDKKKNKHTEEKKHSLEE